MSWWSPGGLVLVSWLSLAGLFGGLRALVVVVMVGVVVRRGWRHDVNAGNTSCDLCFKSLFARDSGRDVLVTMAYHGMLLVRSFAVWGSPLEDNAYNPNYMSTHTNTNTNTNANANANTDTILMLLLILVVRIRIRILIVKINITTIIIMMPRISLTNAKTSIIIAASLIVAACHC